MMNKSRLFASLSLLVFLVSCGSSPPPPAPQPVVRYQTVDYVTVDTAGVTIAASDGSFSLRNDEVYDTPFQSRNCPREPTTADLESVLQMGGQRVEISHPGYGGDLYGVLAFCPVNSEITGPAVRSHLLQIPQQYVDATSGNRVSVVYEPVGSGSGETMCTNTCEYASDGDCDDGGPGSDFSLCPLGTDCNDCGPRGSAVPARQASWILFLSRIPL